MIYFISDGNYVKIGSATDPQRRLKELQTGHPGDLELLHVIECDNSFEGFLQRLFKDYHERGEWFRFAGLLKEFIEGSYVIGKGEIKVTKVKTKVIEAQKNRSALEWVKESIKILEKEYGGMVPRGVLIMEMNITRTDDNRRFDRIIEFLKDKGQIFEPKKGYLKIA